MTNLTHDSISLRGAGVVTIVQQKHGNRFTLDSLLLVDFCRIKSNDRILEPGAGSGVISLLLAKKFPKTSIVADEFEPHAYELLNQNIEANGLPGRILPGDRNIRYLNRSIAQESFDVIVANPPYIKSGAGRQNPSRERLVARQDLSAPITVWLNLQRLLKNRGRYFLVFPADRATELLTLLHKKKLEPKRLRFVHSYQNKPASLILVEAVKSAASGLVVMPPLIVHEKGGGYSDEMREIYGMSS